MNGRRQDGLEARAFGLAKALAPASLLVGTVGAGMVAGPHVGVLVLAAGALVAAIGALWSSLRALVGETALAPEDAFALGAPSSEEEQKRAVLRAIKDIEFERTVGKISEDDFKVLLARYRGEAKRLLRQIDESRAPERARAEELAASHLAKRGAASEGEPADGGEAPGEVEDSSRPGADESPTSNARKAAAPRRAGKKAKARSAKGGSAARKSCSECGADNEADAAFCKACGARLEVAAEEPS